MRTPEELGRKITELRHEKELTQKALADQIQVTDKAISRWERGLGYPDIHLLEELCNVLDVPLEELLLTPEEITDYPDPLPEASSDESPENIQIPASEDAALSRIKAIRETYVEKQSDFQRKRVKRRNVLLALAGIVCLAVLFCVLPWQKHIDLTLTGEYAASEGETIPVKVVWKGYVQTWLLHTPSYKGDFSIFAAETGDLLFSRRITGRRTANADGMAGALIRKDSVYMFSPMIYLADKNESGIISMLLSDDFSRIWIYRNDALPGEITAADDPDIDLKKVRERLSSTIHISP